MNDILEKVFLVIKDNIEDLSIDSSRIDDDLTQLGLDSIAFIRIVVALEELFDIEVPDEYLLLTEMNTISKMATIVSSATRGLYVK